MPATLFVIGIDEVGRGPIAGPLCVGACLMPIARAADFSRAVSGIKDSKQLTFDERLLWLSRLRAAELEGVCRFSTAFVSEQIIDTKGLSFALARAIARVLSRLDAAPEHCEVLLDGGIRAPAPFILQKTIIKGDEKEPLIASASIVAKVRRDRYMIRQGLHYPDYGFEFHKGYGTKKHFRALRAYGPCEIHRKSFLKSLIKNP